MHSFYRWVIRCLHIQVRTLYDLETEYLRSERAELRCAKFRQSCHRQLRTKKLDRITNTEQNSYLQIRFSFLLISCRQCKLGEIVLRNTIGATTLGTFTTKVRRGWDHHQATQSSLCRPISSAICLVIAWD